MVGDEEYKLLKQKFDVYYEHKLLPILRENEKERHRYFRYFELLLVMAVLFYPCVLYYILTTQQAENDAVIGVILGLSALLLIFFIGPIYLYRKKVKPQIMPEFANFFGSFRYELGGKLPDNLLRTSGIFGEYNTHESDDFFCGSYDEVKISIAEERLQHVKTDMKNNKIKKDVFAGVCILLEMNKSFKGKTLVLTDLGVFNGLYALKKFEGLENVKLEDLRFEKFFEVYSDDQIEARYLLTTAFMERMLQLMKLFAGKHIQFCFDKSCLLIAIPTRQNMFEANSFFRTNLNKSKIDLVFEEFYTIFSIIKILKLNQRIGM